MSFKFISAILLLSLSTFFATISGQSKIGYDLDGNPVYEIKQGEKGPEIRFFPASGNTQQKSTQTNLSSNKTNESENNSFPKDNPVNSKISSDSSDSFVEKCPIPSANFSSNSSDNEDNLKTPKIIVHGGYDITSSSNSPLIKNCEPRPRSLFPLFNSEEKKELKDLQKITDSEALITRLNNLLEQKHKKEPSSWSYTGDESSPFIFYGITGVTSYKTLKGDFFYVKLSYILDLRMTSDNIIIPFDFYQPLSREALQQLIEDLISGTGVPLISLGLFPQKDFAIGTNQSSGTLLLSKDTFIIINNKDSYTSSLVMFLQAFSDNILLIK